MEEPIELTNKPDYHTICGLTISVPFKETALRYAMNYEPHPGDTVIVTYPKCGTTWVQYIVYLLKHNGETLPPGKVLYEEIPFIEWIGNEIEKFSPPRLLKTHLPATHFPVCPEAKYIYVVRNPKDCCVSFYHHTLGFQNFYRFNGTFDDYFECFINGKVDWNDYFDHMLSWWPHKDKENFLFLVYEDMIADPEGTVRKIAKFLGKETESLLEKEGMAEKITRESAFDSMKSKEGDLQYPQVLRTNKFFRKGKTGDWRNHFSEEQRRRLDERMRQKIGGTEMESLLKRITT